MRYQNCDKLQSGGKPPNNFPFSEGTLSVYFAPSPLPLVAKALELREGIFCVKVLAV